MSRGLGNPRVMDWLESSNVTAMAHDERIGPPRSRPNYLGATEGRENEPAGHRSRLTRSQPD
jgi:hypothetical protein